MPSVHALLVDTPLLPAAHGSTGAVMPERPSGRDPRRLDRTGRVLAAIQLLAGAAILEELDLWPSRRAIRHARAVATPGGVQIVLGGWPLPLSVVHARLGGGEDALRQTRDTVVGAVAARTGLPHALMAPSGGIDWLTYQPFLDRLLAEAPKPLPAATARSLWAVRLTLPALPDAGEVRYWEVPDARIANRLGAAAVRSFQRGGEPVDFVAVDRDGQAVPLEGVDPAGGTMIVVGAPGARDLLTLERWIESGRLERAAVFGRFPLGWEPPEPVLIDASHPETQLVLAGLPGERSRAEALRRGRRFNPLSSGDRSALTVAAAVLFEPGKPTRERAGAADARVLELLSLDPDGVPEDLALRVSGLDAGTFARRAQALGACALGGSWKLAEPVRMRPGPLHSKMAQLLPDGSPARRLHEVLAGGPTDGLGRWAREALDDLRSAEVRHLLADADPSGLPKVVLTLWIEACLADLDLTQARRLIGILPPPNAEPWRAWLNAIDRPPGTGIAGVPPGAPPRVAAEIALRRLEACRRASGNGQAEWLGVLGRASGKLDGALARRFEIEITLGEVPERFEDRRWRRQVIGTHRVLEAALMRRTGIILMDRGEGREAERIFRRLASCESRPGPAGLLQLDLGWLALSTGDWRTADARHFRAYRLLRAAGFMHKTRDVLFNLAVSDLDHLNVARARERFEAAAGADDPMRRVEQARLELAVGDEAAFRASVESLRVPGEMGGLGLEAGISFLRGVEALLKRLDEAADEALRKGGQEAEAWLDLLDALRGRDGLNGASEDGWGVSRCARLVRRLESLQDGAIEELPGAADVRSAFAVALCERLAGRQSWVPAGWRREAAAALTAAGLDGWAEVLRGAPRQGDGFLGALRRVAEEASLDRLTEDETRALLTGAGVSGLEVRSRFGGRILAKLGTGAPSQEMPLGALTLVPLGGDPGEHDGWALLAALIPLVVEIPAVGSSVDAVTSGLHGESEAIRRLREDIQKLAPTRLPVAFFGETGVGKDVAAQALHKLSGRRGRFVAVNMAALPPHLVEAELFGSVRGAFTGAERSRRGLVLAADGGTLFLDEIGDLDLALQAKLLRFLESGEVRAVGADGATAVDVRIVTATHRDLEKRMREGRFRPDLYYRISSAVVRIPPLRERREDIPVLRALFESHAVDRDGMARVRWSREAEDVLLRYDWPGNVRELRHVVNVAMIRAMGGVVRVEQLPIRAPVVESVSQSGSYEEAMTSFRRRFLEEALVRHGGNRSATARELGISRQTLLYHIRALGLTV
ncbi:MAG: hypothetical protein GXP48_05685 [Acidobacteria bacterium]|nr:hypothetical protein [Acidobacteriota bacterium]